MNVEPSKRRTLCFPALKIHVSNATKEILDKFGTFQVEFRGDIELRGIKSEIRNV